jgi:hypothetical protein
MAAEAVAAINDEDSSFASREPLLPNLHSEVRDLQENFTKYCFQAVSICSIAVGAIFHYSRDNPTLGAVAFVLLPIVLITSRLGTNNYASIQRILGYELHLARTADVPDRFKGRWRSSYSRISWEEAMRAWRIVQPSLYRVIYSRSNALWPSFYNSGFKPNNKDNPFWYCQKSMLGRNRTAVWYPGTYLQVMQRILYSVAAIALFIMLLTPYNVWMSNPKAPAPLAHSLALFTADVWRLMAVELRSLVPAEFMRRLGFGASPMIAQTSVRFPSIYDLWAARDVLVTSLIFVLGLGITLARWFVDRQRRHVMEDGLLSIHACAIVWQAVVIAHFEAVAHAREYGLSTPRLLEIVRRSKGDWQRKLESGDAEELIKGHRPTDADEGHADGAGLTGYTFWLGQEASSLASCAKHIHEWNGFRRCTH